MSALGQKQTYAVQNDMSSLPPNSTAKANFRTRSCPLCPSKVDMCGAARVVRDGLKADITELGFPLEARLYFINSCLCCAAALPLLTFFPLPQRNSLADARSQRLKGRERLGEAGSTSPLPPHTSQCRRPLPLQAGQAVVLWPWHLGHKTLSGIFRFLGYLLL